MYSSDTAASGFADDDRESGIDRPFGFTPSTNSPWSWVTSSSPYEAPAGIVATTSPSPSLDQAGSSPVWTGLLKGLNAAADAFATAAANGGKNRNSALAKGLDAAAKTINDLNRPLTPARYLRATDASRGATQPFFGARAQRPGSWPESERPDGEFPGSRREGLWPEGMNVRWPMDVDAILLDAAGYQGNPLPSPPPGRFGATAEGTRRQAADAWAANPATNAGQAVFPFGNGQGHPADPPDFRATFPRTLDGPVTPEADDLDFETGELDLNRLFGRVADRMVYGHTGFVPATYAAPGLSPGGLTPDYFNPATGARVPGDIDTDTAHRAELHATNALGPASGEGAEASARPERRENGDHDLQRAENGQNTQGTHDGVGQYDARSWPVPVEAAAKLWQDINRGRSGPFIKEGGDPTNPHDYLYPHVAEPPNTPEGQRIRNLIVTYADQFDVPVQLMFNKGWVESRYNQGAISKVGARGIFQLLPQTERMYGVSDTASVEDNVRAASQYMSHLLHLYNGDPVKAEAAYHSGGSVLKGGKYLGPEGFAHLGRVLPGMSDAFRTEKLPPDIMDPYTPFRYFLGRNPTQPHASRR